MGRHRRRPRGREQGDIRRCDPPSCAQCHGTRCHVLPRFAGIGTLFHRTVKPQGAPVAGHVFLQHHGIDAFGQRGPCQHADRLPFGQHPRRVPRRRAPLGQRHRMGPGRAPACKAIAINSRIWQRRIGAACQRVRSGDAPQGGSQRHVFDRGHRMQPCPQLRQRLVHRRPMHARRQGKTVVAQRWRGLEQMFEPQTEHPTLLRCLDIQHLRQIGGGDGGQLPCKLLHLPRILDHVVRGWPHGERRPYLGKDHLHIRLFKRPDRDMIGKTSTQA